MFAALRAAGRVRHQEAPDTLCAKRLAPEKGGEGGIHATREADHDAAESRFSDLIGDESRQHAPQKVAVPGQTDHLIPSRLIRSSSRRVTSTRSSLSNGVAVLARRISA